MRIPPYWAKQRYEGTDRKGRRQAFTASGWSFSSLHEANDDAAARAKHIFELITQGKKPRSYAYHDRPIKEEILEEITDGSSPIGLVTRNRYGALVLNSQNVLFVDVDFPQVKPDGFLDSVVLLFSRKRWNERREAQIQETIQQVQGWAARNGGHSFRLYRTRDGLRLLFTDKLYVPRSEETAAILRELNADPMYVKLTQQQECFRARLTSKPWRCGCPLPPNSFPWLDAEAENAFRQWETQYARKDADYKTCELTREFGRVADIAALKTIVDVHDRSSRIESDAALA